MGGGGWRGRAGACPPRARGSGCGVTSDGGGGAAGGEE